MLVSCQEDIDIDTSDNDTNNSESVFTSRAERVAMFDGAFDDVLDNSPCFAVELPVNILLNSIATTIDTTSDLDLIVDTDVIEFAFPITITNYNHNQIVISDQETFNQLTMSCQELIDNAEGPITCLDFNYPIVVYTTTNNQSQNDFTLNTNEELYDFIQNLNPNDFYSLSYPIGITIDQSLVITVNGDAEIENNIVDCIN